MALFFYKNWCNIDKYSWFTVKRIRKIAGENFVLKFFSKMKNTSKFSSIYNQFSTQFELCVGKFSLKMTQNVPIVVFQDFIW